MKKIILFLFLLTVIISIDQPPQIIGCPWSEPKMIKNQDGSYTTIVTNVTLQVCYSKRANWQEEWTDYPENGGIFIRRLP